MEDQKFIYTDPSVGVKRPKQTSFKVDANGVPLDVVAKQQANNGVGSGDITNDPMFLEMFGSVGKEVKDPIKQGSNEDRWISGNSTPIQETQPKKNEEPKVENMVSVEDPDDISNNPELLSMLNNNKEAKNESDSSDSYTMKNKENNQKL